jgi:hypothetical protein
MQRDTFRLSSSVKTRSSIDRLLKFKLDLIAANTNQPQLVSGETQDLKVSLIQLYSSVYGCAQKS